jgi:hypothetical protein
MLTHLVCKLLAIGAGSEYTAMAPPDYSRLSAINIISIFAGGVVIIGVLLFLLSKIGQSRHGDDY